MLLLDLPQNHLRQKKKKKKINLHCSTFSLREECGDLRFKRMCMSYLSLLDHPVMINILIKMETFLGFRERFLKFNLCHA